MTTTIRAQHGNDLRITDANQALVLASVLRFLNDNTDHAITWADWLIERSELGEAYEAYQCDGKGFIVYIFPDSMSWDDPPLKKQYCFGCGATFELNQNHLHVEEQQCQ